MKYVLDASAVLAVLNSEPGADVVAGRLANGIMSTINAVEVGTKLVDGGMTHEAASQAMSSCAFRSPISTGSSPRLP